MAPSTKSTAGALEAPEGRKIECFETAKFEFETANVIYVNFKM
jgi:hypothetical protein